MMQSELPTITCNLLKAQEKLQVQTAFGFASHWLKIFKPMTKRNHIILLSTALSEFP